MAENPTLESLAKLETALEEEQQRLIGAQDNIAEKITTTRQMLRACAGKMEKHKQELETLSSATRDRLRDIRTHIENIPDTVEQQSALDALNQTLAEKEESILQLNTQLAEMEEKSNGYGARIQELEQQITDSGEEDASATARIQELETTILKLKEDVAQAEQQARESADANNDIEALKTELDDTRPKLENAEAALAAKEGEIGPLQKTIDILRTEHSILEEEHAALKANLEKQQQQDTAHTEAIARLEKELAEKGEALKTLQTERDTLPSPEAVAQLEEDLAGAQAARAAAEESHRVMEATLNEERAQYKQSTLAIQLADALKDAEEMRETLNAMQSQPGASSGAPGSSDDTELIARIQGAAKALGKGSKRSIGEILIVADVISEENLEEAIAEQRSNPQQHLGAILIDKGYASDVAVAQALALQCKVPYQRIDKLRIESDATVLLNGRLAQQHRCIPFKTEENRVHVAMSNPMDLVAIEDIERATGKQVEYVVVTEGDMDRALAKHYA